MMKHIYLALMMMQSRELKAENERLKSRMGKGDVSEEELKDMAGKGGGEVGITFHFVSDDEG